MKQLKKGLALLLCAVLLLACVSCVQDADENLPEGMKLATAPGCDFRLYVPTVWNVNTAYGVSGAYYNMSTQSSVNVVKYPISSEMSVEYTLTDQTQYEETGGKTGWFWFNYCLPAIEDAALSGSLSEVTSTADMLNKLNAWKYTLHGTVNGSTLYFMQVVTERSNAFYVFSYTAEEDLYETLMSQVEQMLDNFIFAEPYYPDDYVKNLDAEVEAPEGMKLASNDDVAYRFYVPTTWEINREEEIFAAYWKEDRSGVSVVPYQPDVESMSVAEFFTMSQEMMQNTAGADGYELLGYETVDMGGRKATAYEYTYTVGGVQYKYKQVIAAYKSMLYSLTYTALPEHYDAHLNDVNAMVEAFEFR